MIALLAALASAAGPFIQQGVKYVAMPILRHVPDAAKPPVYGLMQYGIQVGLSAAAGAMGAHGLDIAGILAGASGTTLVATHGYHAVDRWRRRVR